MDPEELDTQGQDLETTDTGGAPMPGGDGQEGEAVGSATEALLDSLSAGGEPDHQERQRDPLGRFVAADGGLAQSAAAPAQQPATAAAGAAAIPGKPAASPTPEQEEAELLAGIKSDRGRARVQQIIEARKEAEGGLAAVRDMVQAAGMTTETFSQHIEFSRLANSNNPQDLERAAQMLEQTRADLYRRIGKDAPGVDVLSDFPDLAQQVQNLMMPRETALEVARLRRNDQALQAQQQQQRQAEQETKQFHQAVAQAQQSLETYVQTRAHEIDHPARMKALETYFADPRKLQEFASTYQPHQWPAAIRMLYDNVQVSQPRRSGPAPISSRAASLGRPVSSAAQQPEERIMSLIDNMGL
ncbi:hypothetical protein [Achromobacter insolitus]|uniref:hypothetical protein n=1 Tax=Achromobacter insolitus TaxID=217204 RepID=UPI002FE0B286